MGDIGTRCTQFFLSTLSQTDRWFALLRGVVFLGGIGWLLFVPLQRQQWVILAVLLGAPHRFLVGIGVAPALLRLVFVLARVEALEHLLHVVVLHGTSFLEGDQRCIQCSEHGVEPRPQAVHQRAFDEERMALAGGRPQHAPVAHAVGDRLAAVVREADGRGPRTHLTPLVMEHFGLTRVDGLVREVYDRRMPRQAVAALGPLIDRARTEGDVAAADILRKAGEELTCAASSVRKLRAFMISHPLSAIFRSGVAGVTTTSRPAI